MMMGEARPAAHGGLSTAEIRRLRPSVRRPKAEQAWQPQAVELESERRGAAQVQAATLFLTGAECPYTCVFCDLWRYTLESPTPPGAIPAQIEAGLETVRSRLGGEPLELLKLYNASNFFEERAVPSADDGTILETLHAGAEPTPQVLVECHPRVLLSAEGERRLELYASSVSLEVAIGVECASAGALQTLNKGCSLADVERAFERVQAAGASIRTFVLLGVPSIDHRHRRKRSEQVEWTVDSVRWVRERGARSVSLIPVRGGNGAMERLLEVGAWRPPTLLDVDASFREALALQTESFDVTLDLWDLETVDSGGLSPEEAALLRDELTSVNRTGVSA